MSGNKKIYVPVIAYGGMCRAEYSMSLSALYVKTLQERPDISFFSTGILFESLVSRARNSAAAAALHYKCDYLLFITFNIFIYLLFIIRTNIAYICIYIILHFYLYLYF